MSRYAVGTIEQLQELVVVRLIDRNFTRREVMKPGGTRDPSNRSKYLVKRGRKIHFLDNSKVRCRRVSPNWDVRFKKRTRYNNRYPFLMKSDRIGRKCSAFHFWHSKYISLIVQKIVTFELDNFETQLLMGKL